MGFFLPSYITTNRLGIYLFQARIPKHIHTNKAFFRKSLRTRNQEEAIRLSRSIKWGFDELLHRYPNDPERFAGGLDALREITLAPSSLPNIPSFLDSINKPVIDNSCLPTQATNQHLPETDSPQLKPMNDNISLITKNLKHLDSAPLSQLIDTYLEEKKTKWSVKDREKNLKDVKPKLTLLTDIIGDIKSDDLQHAHIVSYKTALLQLPSNRKKGIFKSLSVDQILQLDIPAEKRLSTETLKNNIGKISSFLHWLAANNYSQSNLSDPLQGATPPSKQAHEQRSIFTSEQLVRLFHSEQYTQDSHKQPSHYWVPLLALFTGARQTELCQLYREDIYQFEDSGIWVIDINDKHGDQSLKRSHHARIVPIHKQLIVMGFIDYVNGLQHQRLFSDLQLKRDGYGQSFSRWFCRTYLNEKNCNIKSEGESPVFHSFRHTFVTRLDHMDIQPHHISHIVGHTPNGSETVNRYAKPKDMVMRSQIINRLNYSGIDFGIVQKWIDNV
jgi:integrase